MAATVDRELAGKADDFDYVWLDEDCAKTTELEGQGWGGLGT